MAYVASNSTDPTSQPLMDRLTHAIIKETSKNLKYYIDIKRRENAFVLNSKSPLRDSTSIRAKRPCAATREHLSLYSSHYADKDITNFLPSFPQKQRQNHSTSISPEKQMCREELNFHMRSYNFSPRETLKPLDFRLKPTTRSTSSCGGNRDCRSRTSLKLTRNEQDQLIDDAADILASLVKSRRSTNETNSLKHPTSPLYVTHNTNASPRQTDNQPTVKSSMNYPASDLRIFSIKQNLKREKRFSQDAPPKTTSILSRTKLITKGFLCEYKISITTGNCNGASTNAPIRIRLNGTSGHTNFHELIQSESHRIPFQKDQTDIFTLQTYHVGELQGITIGHDRKDMRASWFLSKISINDPIRHKTYQMLCNAWLSIKSNDQKTMRDFHVTSTVSHTKTIISNEYHEEHESQSDYSTRTIESTVLSNEINLNDNISQIDHKQIKAYQKSQHVSIDPTILVKNLSSASEYKSSHSQLSTSPPSNTTATIDTHFNQNDLLFPPIVPRIHSPALSTASSDTDIESNITNRTRSTSRTPSPTFHQTRLQPVSEYDTLQTISTSSLFKRHSIDHDRPPARLEKRVSPLSKSPERPYKNNEENNENNYFSFIE